MRRWQWFILVGGLTLGVLSALPLTVAAQTNSDILAILRATFDANLEAMKAAYCASGVTALCP